jgi:hypothetical protein
MILHLIAMVSMLALDLVSTSTTAEVSAILPSEAYPVLHRSSRSPIHVGPNQHPSRHLAISCSYPTNLSNLISSAAHSTTSFKTHRP